MTDVYRIVGNEVVRGVLSGSYLAKGEYTSLVDALTELKHKILATGVGPLGRVELELAKAIEAARPE